MPVKITELPPVASAQLADIFPVVQGGQTSQESNSQLMTLINNNAAFLPLGGGTLTGNLSLRNFSEFYFLNNAADATNCIKYGMYDYSGTGLYALTLDSIEGGVAKQTFVVFQDDPGTSGQVKYSFSFPKVSRNITMTDQGVWTGAQPTLPIVVNSVSNNIAIIASSGIIFQTTLTENTTINAPSSPVNGMTIQIWIKQNASSSYTVALDPVFVPNANSPSFSMSPTLNSVVCITATLLFGQWNYGFV